MMGRYQYFLVLVCFALLITKSQSKPANPIVDASLCEFCKTYVQEFIQIVNVGTATVEQKVKTVCDKVAHSIADECATFIDKFIDRIIKGIEKQYTPDVICQDISLC